MAATAYNKYVLTKPKTTPMQRPLSSKTTFGLSAELMKGIKQFDASFQFVAILTPHVLADPPHKHNCDEILFFMSADPDNPHDLGGEMEIALGDEWEKQVINTSAILCIPAGLTHCPVYARRVDRPFYFGHLLLASSYGSSAIDETGVTP
jgi:hypothetical protein